MFCLKLGGKCGCFINPEILKFSVVCGQLYNNLGSSCESFRCLCQKGFKSLSVQSEHFKFLRSAISDFRRTVLCFGKSYFLPKGFLAIHSCANNQYGQK